MTKSIQRKSWSNEEDEFLKRNYLRKPVKDLAGALCRTEKAVIARAAFLNVKKVKQNKTVDLPEFLYVKKPLAKELEEQHRTNEVILVILLIANTIGLAINIALKVF